MNQMNAMNLLPRHFLCVLSILFVVIAVAVAVVGLFDLSVSPLFLSCQFPNKLTTADK